MLIHTHKPFLTVDVFKMAHWQACKAIIQACQAIMQAGACKRVEHESLQGVQLTSSSSTP